MNDLEDILNIYRPLNINRIKNCILLDTMEGKYVLKTNSKIDYSTLYKYLKSRSFNYFPSLYDIRDNNVIFEYQEDVFFDNNQKALDLVKVVALLHNKTCYFKDVSSDLFLNLYNDLRNNTLFLENEFNNYFDKFIFEENIIPSHTLFLYNYSSFYGAIKCLKDILEKWYLEVKDLSKMRVCVNHNNLCLEHFIKNESEYLISWDNYIIDTPVLDFANFYKTEWERLEFSQLYNAYNEIFHLLDNEKMLLCIIMLDIDSDMFSSDEMDNCVLVRKKIEYLNKTYELFKLIWPEEFK